MKCIIYFACIINIFSQTFIFGTTVNKGTRTFSELEVVWQMIFEPLGIEYSVESFAGQRLYVQFNNGIIQGALTQPLDTNEGFRNYVLVEEPYTRGDMYIVTLDEELNDELLIDGKGVGVRSNLIAKIAREKELNMEYVTTIEQGKKLLLNRRVDYFMLIGVEAENLSNKHPSIYMSKEPVYSFDVYMLLSRDYADLAKRIEVVIKELREQDKLPYFSLEEKIE